MRERFERLKEIANVQERVRAFRDLAYEVEGYARTLYEDNIVTKEYICDRVKEEASNGNLESIRIMLADVNDYQAEFFRVDGYENFETITSELLDAIIDDVISDLN